MRKAKWQFGVLDVTGSRRGSEAFGFVLEFWALVGSPGRPQGYGSKNPDRDVPHQSRFRFYRDARFRT
jgi:hypothetical protein